MKSIEVKICYFSHKSPEVIVDKMPGGNCYQIANIEIPDKYEIAKNTYDETLLCLDGKCYLLDDILVFNDKIEKVCLLDVWTKPNANNDNRYITLRTDISDSIYSC